MTTEELSILRNSIPADGEGVEARLLRALDEANATIERLKHQPEPQYVTAGDPTAHAWMCQCRAAETKLARLQAALAKYAAVVEVRAGIVTGRPDPMASCYFCGARTEDGTVADIPHADDCPVTLAREAVVQK